MRGCFCIDGASYFLPGDYIFGLLFSKTGFSAELLEVYLDTESKLDELDIVMYNPAYEEQHRVLSNCLIRQGNIVRQMKKPEEAFALSERELATEHTSESEIMMDLGFLKNGTNYIITGEVEQGLTLMKEDCGIFEVGDRYNLHQGLGWYLILQTDLVNAEITQREPSEVVEIPSLALEILTPIENLPGVERAWVSCAKAHENLENEDEAVKDLKEFQHYVSKIKLQESAGLQ